MTLVNARYAKNVPGPKTDVSDAGWLRQLHSYGLLRGSFRPEAEIATLRASMRQRERLVECAAPNIQHMHKAMMEMNLQVHHVMSDITGDTGMRIIRAIVAGERDPHVLASLRDVRCHPSVETISAALVGNDGAEHTSSHPHQMLRVFLRKAAAPKPPPFIIRSKISPAERPASARSAYLSKCRAIWRNIP